MRSAASAVRTCAPPAQSGRAGRFFRCGRPLVLQACSSACETALTGAALWGAMPAAPVAGLQRARPRESAPAYSWQIGRARAPRGASDGGDPQRARPASGAPNVSRGQQEARGARQRVALCFGSRGGRARPVPIEELEPGVRVPRHFLELCEWFRDCSQASGASQRVWLGRCPQAQLSGGLHARRLHPAHSRHRPAATPSTHTPYPFS